MSRLASLSDMRRKAEEEEKKAGEARGQEFFAGYTLSMIASHAVQFLNNF
jgi:hypothetical protein